MSFVVAVFVCLFVLCGSDEIFGGKKLELFPPGYGG